MQQVALRHAPTAARQLRAQLRAWLEQCPEAAEVADDAVLVASELLGNAVLHARPLPDGGLRVSWGLEQDGLELQMTDGGSLGAPHVRPPDPNRPTGRGLAIIDHLALRWGVREQADRSTVWVVLPVRTRSRTGNTGPGPVRP